MSIISIKDTYTRPRATLEAEMEAFEVALRYGRSRTLFERCKINPFTSFIAFLLFILLGITKLNAYTNFGYGKRCITEFIEKWEEKAEEDGKKKGDWLRVTDGGKPANIDLIKRLKEITDSFEAVKWVMSTLHATLEFIFIMLILLS